MLKNPCFTLCDQHNQNTTNHKSVCVTCTYTIDPHYSEILIIDSHYSHIRASASSLNFICNPINTCGTWWSLADASQPRLNWVMLCLLVSALIT